MTCRPAHTELLSESKCHLAPTFCSQGSQPLTWAQARCSCLAECPLCPFWAITHAASLLWIFRTLPPSLLSSAPAPLAVVVCRSTGRHTWRDTQRVCVCYYHSLYNIYLYYAVFLWEYECCFFDSYLAPVIQHTMNIMYKTVTHTLMESCCVEEFLPSAETEDIWGFTRAIEMVGGVSLVIFFSLCKGDGFKIIIIWKANSQHYLRTHKKVSSHASSSVFQHPFMEYMLKLSRPTNTWELCLVTNWDLVKIQMPLWERPCSFCLLFISWFKSLYQKENDWLQGVV